MERTFRLQLYFAKRLTIFYVKLLIFFFLSRCLYSSLTSSVMSKNFAVLKYWLTLWFIVTETCRSLLFSNLHLHSFNLSVTYLSILIYDASQFPCSSQFVRQSRILQYHLQKSPRWRLHLVSELSCSAAALISWRDEYLSPCFILK